MARCPFAVNRLIPPGSSDPRISPRIAILHVDAGNTRDLHDYFDGPSGGIESHFQIALDGTIFQYRDTDYEADANYRANPFAISIETQGFGEGEWTPEQVASIKRLLIWLNQVHPAIRLAECTVWDGAGVGFHIKFGTPGYWTNVSKSCPGPNRVRQFWSIIVPWLKSGAHNVQEDDMTPEQTATLNQTAAAAKRIEAFVKRTLGPEGAIRKRLAALNARAKSQGKLVGEVRELVEALPDSTDRRAVLRKLDNLQEQVNEIHAATADDIVDEDLIGDER